MTDREEEEQQEEESGAGRSRRMARNCWCPTEVPRHRGRRRRRVPGEEAGGRGAPGPACRQRGGPPGLAGEGRGPPEGGTRSC